jgi:hypothetical protein
VSGEPRGDLLITFCWKPDPYPRPSPSPRLDFDLPSGRTRCSSLLHRRAPAPAQVRARDALTSAAWKAALLALRAPIRSAGTPAGRIRRHPCRRLVSAATAGEMPALLAFRASQSNCLRAGYFCRMATQPAIGVIRSHVASSRKSGVVSRMLAIMSRTPQARSRPKNEMTRAKTTLIVTA